MGAPSTQAAARAASAGAPSRWAAALLTAAAVLALLVLQEAPAQGSLLRSAALTPARAAPPPSPPPPPRRLGALQLSAECSYPGIEEDRNLSYPLPAFFPLPALPLVMETMQRACDLCWTRLGDHPNPCEMMSGKQTWAPDPHVREALLSALLPCALAPDSCNFLDAGANMGVFSLWAWGLGARVVAVEPQPDLAAALRRSVRLNCAGGGGIEVVEGGLTAVGAAGAGSGGGGYRGAPAGQMIQMFAGPTGEANYAYRQCQLPASVEPVVFHTSTDGEAPLVLVDDVVLQRKHWALVKIDIDGYDGDLLHRILALVQRGAVAVDTFIVEMNNCKEEQVCTGAVHLAHELGYTIYKLNVHDNRRAFDERGWDVVSNFKPLALPYYFSEVQTRRAMRFAYELLKGRPQEEYTPLFGGEIIELVFTRQDWAEPVVFNTEKAPLSPEY